MSEAQTAKAKLDTNIAPQLLILIDELLDAQLDTLELGAELSHDPQWGAHLDYVRALHRAGSRSLAELASTPARR